MGTFIYYVISVTNFRILALFLLILVFSLLGVLLDYRASQRWVELSDKQDAGVNKAMVEYVKNAQESLNNSAKVLYDLSKVTLGVLVTLIVSSSVIKGKSPQSDDGTKQSAPTN